MAHLQLLVFFDFMGFSISSVRSGNLGSDLWTYCRLSICRWLGLAGKERMGKGSVARERRGPPRPAQVSDANEDVGAPGRSSLPLHATSHPANIEPHGSWEKLLPTFAACGNNHSEYRVCLMARNKRTNPQNASIRGTDPMPERGAIFATSGQSSPPPRGGQHFGGDVKFRDLPAGLRPA